MRTKRHVTYLPTCATPGKEQVCHIACVRQEKKEVKKLSSTFYMHESYFSPLFFLVRNAGGKYFFGGPRRIDCSALRGSPANQALPSRARGEDNKTAEKKVLPSSPGSWSSWSSSSLWPSAPGRQEGREEGRKGDRPEK